MKKNYKPSTKPGKSHAQILLEIHLGELGLKFVAEYKFHPDRDWRFDYLLVIPTATAPGGVYFYSDVIAAIEIEGGIFKNGRLGSGPGVGRHLRGLGYLADMQKYREAAALGYKVFRFSPQEVLNGTALEFLKQHVVSPEPRIPSREQNRPAPA